MRMNDLIRGLFRRNRAFIRPLDEPVVIRQMRRECSAHPASAHNAAMKVINRYRMVDLRWTQEPEFDDRVRTADEKTDEENGLNE